MYTLQIDNLHKRYGTHEVLKGVSLTAKAGDVIWMALSKKEVDKEPEHYTEEIPPQKRGPPALWLRQDQRLGDRIQTMVIGLVLGTCLLGLAVAGWQMQHTLRDRQAAAADQATAARLLAASDHPAGLAEAALALLDKRPPQELRALTLARLAQRLPDATWAVGLRIDAAGFELSGISAQPEALVPLLEADPGLEQVQLSATSAREADSGLFTFTISGRASPTGEGP